MSPPERQTACITQAVCFRAIWWALQLIIVQGEGAPDESETSHFESFNAIKTEFATLSAARPAFRPSRNVARNPVMRRPLDDGRVHVTDTAAAPVLDAVNATYSLMLRCLTLVFDTKRSDAPLRKTLLSCAMGLMKAVAGLSDVLTRLPASAGSDFNAGVTFTMLRSTEGLVPGTDVPALLAHRFDRIATRLGELDVVCASNPSLISDFTKMRDSILTAQG